MRARTGFCLLLLLGGGLLAGAPPASAQVWTQLSPNTSPPARYFHYTATTGAGQVLLFGGRSGGTFYNDTWLWGGSDWMKPPQIGNGPSPRAAHTMCTDDQGRVILYSGWNNSNYVADTWIYGSGGWTNAQPQNIPSPRDWTSMARDGHGNVVMYGGHDWQLVVAGNGHHDDTWLFDGTNWIQANPTTVPQERWGHAMAYDPSTDSVLMFGGVGNGTGVLNDLWRWDGTNWTQLSPLASPTPRRTVSMVHDPVRNRMVVVGGIDANGQILSDTWEYDGVSWAQTSTGAPALGLTHQSWDPSRQEVLLFGGTTALSPSASTADATTNSYLGPAANWQNLGQALAGAGGDPVLSGQGDLLAGSQVTLTLSNAAPSSVANLVIGIQNLSVPFYGGTLVPSANIMISLPTSAGGSLSLQAPFPGGVPSGVPFYFQYWIQDATAPQGLSASNAMVGTSS